MSQIKTTPTDTHVLSQSANDASPFVIVCEHASNHFPASFKGLGLPEGVRTSHVAWDPGAMPVATRLANQLGAGLVASGVSRLIYDCNRSPSAKDAMPVRSEVFDIPGNANLSQADRDARTNTFYRPFEAALSEMVASVTDPIIVTVHSFSPVFHGAQRSVEVGILHDVDTRLADIMLAVAAQHTDANVQRNVPYGPEHGVTHTLKVHGVKHGHPNVMLEIRNDLIVTPDQQAKMADMLASWISQAFTSLQTHKVVQC